VLTRLAHLQPLDPASPLFGSFKHPGRLMEELRAPYALAAHDAAGPRFGRGLPETLRHFCISSLLSRGAPLLYVAQQSGHSARNARPAGTSRW
jgi:hypothetical protein